MTTDSHFNIDAWTEDRLIDHLLYDHGMGMVWSDLTFENIHEEHVAQHIPYGQEEPVR